MMMKTRAQSLGIARQRHPRLDAMYVVAGGPLQGGRAFGMAAMPRPAVIQFTSPRGCLHAAQVVAVLHRPSNR